jgi:hypothetical protein
MQRYLVRYDYSHMLSIQMDNYCQYNQIIKKNKIVMKVSHHLTYTRSISSFLNGVRVGRSTAALMSSSARHLRPWFGRKEAPGRQSPTRGRNTRRKGTHIDSLTTDDTGSTDTGGVLGPELIMASTTTEWGFGRMISSVC